MFYLLIVAFVLNFIVFHSPAFFVVLGFCLALTLGTFLIPQILFLSHKKKLYDMPNERKVHDLPVPRLGGLAFMPSLFIAFGLIIALRIRLNLSVYAFEGGVLLLRFLVLTIGLMCLYFLGLADDLIGVSYRRKFVAQSLAATLLAVSTCWINNMHGFLGLHELPIFIGIPFTIFVVVYITNAINLIDGIDGLASGLCALALLAFSLLFFSRGEYYNSLVSACTLGAVLPFWFTNIFGSAPRGNKLFMGDTGSLTLGFVLSYLVISACQTHPLLLHNKFDAVVAFSILFIPLIDVVRVVVHRLRHGRNPFLPDRNHFHHKLLRMGISSRWVLVCILCYALFFLGLNVSLVHYLDVNLTWIVGIDLVLWTASQVVFTILGSRELAKQRLLGKD